MRVRLARPLKKAYVVILRSQGDEESLVISLGFFASLRITGLLRGFFNTLSHYDIYDLTGSRVGLHFPLQASFQVIRSHIQVIIHLQT